MTNVTDDSTSCVLSKARRELFMKGMEAVSPGEQNVYKPKRNTLEYTVHISIIQ